MNIPNLPAPHVPISDVSGKMHPTWYNFFNQLINESQTNLSQEGLGIPMQSASNISTIGSARPTPRFIVDSDSNSLKVALGGVIKTVTTV
jgi:hypothetical protein